MNHCCSPFSVFQYTLKHYVNHFKPLLYLCHNYVKHKIEENTSVAGIREQRGQGE